MSGERLHSLEQADTQLGLSDLASEARRGSGLGDDRVAHDAIKARLFPTEAAPATIGRFTVLRPLGAGGMSYVYAAYDERLDRRIAVKLLRRGESQDSQARLLREAQAMARLSHPNVVAVHEVGTWEGQVYIAMEFVRGQNLRDWLAAVPRDIPEILEAFDAAGRGLAAAHRAGLVHRDFKPANVLVGEDGRVRVLDFGLVRRAGDDDAAPASHVPSASLVDAPVGRDFSATLTATGAILGTPAYMSPEQHLGRSVDARSDQFSFCVALYEALHGAPPFGGRNLAEIAERVLAGRIEPVPEDSKVPAWLRRVVARGLAVDPAARWPTIDDLLDELGRDPGRVWRVRRNATLLGLAVVTLVVGLAIVARERADAAAQARRAEAAAERQREAAEGDRAAAERERDRAFREAKIQLEEATQARATLKEALDAAEAQRLNAEAHAQLAEDALAEAERRRKEAEGERKEAERQTSRAVQEAARARDANRLAQALAGARGDPTTVLALLREVEDPADAPGWVPAAVAALLEPTSAAVLRSHRGALVGAAFSGDGRRVATIGEDHQVSLWSWSDDHVLEIHEHAGPVRAVAFAGDAAISVAADGAALWRDPPAWLGAGDDLRAVAVAPDGRVLVTGGADGRVRAWELGGAPAAGRELARHDGPVHAVAFDRAGRRVVSAGADGTARLVDLRGGAARSLAHPSSAVRCAAFSPDGRTIATGAQDGLVRLWSVEGPAEPRLLRGHADEVVAVAFSPDGERLASASLDRSARLWSSTGAPQRALTGHAGRVYDLAFSPDGERLVTASQDGTARVWSTQPVPGDTPMILRGHSEAVVAAAFSPTGDHVVTASRDGTARVWRVRGGAPLVREVRLGGPVRQLAWDGAGLVALRDGGRAVRIDGAGHTARLGDVPKALWIGPGPEGQVLAFTSLGELRGWDGAGAALPARAAARPGAEAAAASPDGRRLALALPDGAALVDLSSGTQTPLAGHAGSVTALAFSPDGAALATGAADRVARLFDLGRPGAPARAFGPHSGSVTALAFSPDGRRLATASWDRRARIWDLAGGQPALLEEHRAPLRALAWRPDGGALATAGDDATVRIWPQDGRGEPIVLTGHRGPVRALAWSPAGDALASAGDDGRVLLWTAEFAPASLQARLRAASPVCLSARQRGALLAEPVALAEANARACQASARR